jgi:hypothetical protein
MTQDVRDHRHEEPPIRNSKRTIPRGGYLRATNLRHGPTRLRPSVAAIANTPGMRARAARPVAGAVAAPLPPPQVAATDGVPDGFGRQLNWAGEEDFAVAAFLNAGDDFGLCVSGVRDGDTFEFVAGAGHASFSTDTRNNGIAGLIGVVEVGAGIVAAAYGLPEVIPLIHAGSEYAQQQFPESEQPSKRRNVFGEDDGGGRARAEGGVIVCEPRAQGLYYSASAEHQDRWIQPDGTRDDSNQPRHIPVNDAFFLRRHMGRERLHGTGNLFVCAWDGAHQDNQGFYELRFILRRGEDRDRDTPVG